MEYCSPLVAGSSASHLAQLDAVENKAFNIIGIPRDVFGTIASPSLTGRWSLCLLPHFFWTCTLCPLRALSLPGNCRTHTVHRSPLLVKRPKSRPTAHLHSFSPCFSHCGTTFNTLFNLILPSRSSRQLFTTISSQPHPKS